MWIKNSKIRQQLAKNRYWIAFGIIGFILLLLILGNLSAMEQNKIDSNEIVGFNKAYNIYQPQETTMIGDDVSKTEQTQYSNLIDQFVQFCNEGEAMQAYQLLTKECKEELYPDVQTFYRDYIQTRFKVKRDYSLQSWFNSNNVTYRVSLIEDMLSTGKVSGNEKLEEYYTVVRTKEGNRLNIGEFIEREEINKQVTKNGFTIKVKQVNRYVSYEIYEIELENNTSHTILLDTQTKNDSSYIQSRNETKYRAFFYEMGAIDLEIQPKVKKSLKIRYNKMFNPNVDIQSIHFEDIISNKEDYDKLQDKTQYQDRMTIEIKW